MDPSVKDRLTTGRGTHLKRALHDAVDPGCVGARAAVPGRR